MIWELFLTQAYPTNRLVLLLFLGDMHSCLSLSVYRIKMQAMVLMTKIEREISGGVHADHLIHTSMHATL